jgi:hypothetical protein
MKNICQKCAIEFEAPPSQNAKFCGLICKNESLKNKTFSTKTQFKKGQTAWNKNKTTSLEIKQKISLATKKAMREPILRKKMLKIYQERKGNTFLGSEKGFFTRERTKQEKNVNWKGGVSPLNSSIRASKEYKKWRNEVYNRDYWTCQSCGIKSHNIIAHHIYPFSQYPEYRFEVENGITFCCSCHPHIKQITT